MTSGRAPLGAAAVAAALLLPVPAAQAVSIKAVLAYSWRPTATGAEVAYACQTYLAGGLTRTTCSASPAQPVAVPTSNTGVVVTSGPTFTLSLYAESFAVLGPHRVSCSKPKVIVAVGTTPGAGTVECVA